MAHCWRLAGDFTDPREMRNALNVSAIMPAKESALFDRANGCDHIGNPFAAPNFAESPIQRGLNVAERVTSFERVANRADGILNLAHLSARLAMASGYRIAMTGHL
jgi:hypothetical protein